MAEKNEEHLSKGSGLLLLWTGVLAAPLAWALHMQLAYSVVPWVCSYGKHFLLHLITIVALLLAAGGGFAAWRSWQLSGQKWQTEGGGVIQRSRFMAVLGLLTSAMFLLVIIAQEIPSFFFDPCQR